MIEQTKKPDFSKIQCFALDMDGTFYLGDTLIPGALEFIEKVKNTQRKFVFLTNNSSKNREDYIRKLRRMGLEVPIEAIVSSGQATIRYLLREYSGKSVFLLGNAALEDEFKEAGISLCKDGEIVVTAFDTSLDYEKMCIACGLVRRGHPYIATHPDFNCPTEDGFIPDIGAIHAFIHASTGRMPDEIIGKPYKEIMNCAMDQVGCKASEMAMVGDRMYTDIALTAQVPGLTGILVLSGESGPEDIAAAKIKPHFVFDSLRNMLPCL